MATHDRHGDRLDDEHDRLLDELAAARATLRATRDAAARREAGAADVATAEYRLSGILARLDRLGWHEPPPEAA